jgi:hypothetical protein
MCFWGESKNVRSGRVFDWDEMQKDGKVIFCGFGEDPDRLFLRFRGA